MVMSDEPQTDEQDEDEAAWEKMDDAWDAAFGARCDWMDSREVDDTDKTGELYSLWLQARNAAMDATIEYENSLFDDEEPCGECPACLADTQKKESEKLN
jgi:hypothetical protein